MISLEVSFRRSLSHDEAAERVAQLQRAVPKIMGLEAEWLPPHGLQPCVATLKLLKRNFQSVDAVRKQFDAAAKIVAKAAQSCLWVVAETVVIATDGERVPVHFDLPEPAVAGYVRSRVDVEIPPLDDTVYGTHFGRLYNREAHIRLIYDSAAAAVRTRFKDRHHVLLHSPAACAKSELLIAFCEWFGEDLVWRVDAGTMTKAGLEKQLLQRCQQGAMQPFVVIEEIEKAEERNLLCLLQVMDRRGRIQRTMGNKAGDSWEWCQIVIWATCNDTQKLRGFMSSSSGDDGALWSRFAAKLKCDRPDQATMFKILAQHILDTAGDPKWAGPVVDFMYGELAKTPGYAKDYNDPRLGLFMLSGGPRLLDGSFFADFRATAG